MKYAIGIALWDSLWQGIFVAAGLWMTLRMLPPRRPDLRYGAAVVSLLLSVGWFVATMYEAYQTTAPQPLAASIVDPIVTWQTRFAWLWIAGVCSVYMQRLASWAVLWRRVRSHTEEPEMAWLSALDAAKSRMQVVKRIAVRRADWLRSPSVFGWLKPVILIPAGVVAGLTPEQLEAILAHELAHIVRQDYLVNLLQTAAETLLFYHPAVWWISRQIRQERECCCDEMAVRAAGNRTLFAGALLQLEEQRVATMALAASQGPVRLRIERLFDMTPRPKHPWIVPLLAVICIAGPYLYAQAQGIQTPYTKWVSEDVTYIISAEERKAFENLKTDEERNQFIAQFWKRRDPTPDTDTNEAKEEHYRRIHYANQKFTSAANVGWKSDQGRVYILNGPPDEIESHPNEKRDEWLYRHLADGAVVIYRFENGVLKRP